MDCSDIMDASLKFVVFRAKPLLHTSVMLLVLLMLFVVFHNADHERKIRRLPVEDCGKLRAFDPSGPQIRARGLR